MFAIIKNDKIDFLNFSEIEWENCIEYDHEIILNPLFKNGKIIETPPTKEQKDLIELSEIKSQIIDGSLTEKPKDVMIPPLDVGQIIIEKNFGGNINAQLAALSKSNIKMLAILAKVVGLPTIQAVFTDEITLARSISDTRVLCGFSPLDLSFLD